MYLEHTVAPFSLCNREKQITGITKSRQKHLIVPKHRKQLKVISTTSGRNDNIKDSDYIDNSNISGYDKAYISDNNNNNNINNNIIAM